MEKSVTNATWDTELEDLLIWWGRIRKQSLQFNDAPTRKLMQAHETTATRKTVFINRLLVSLTRATNKKTNSMALSPRMNCTDWATATCRRYLTPPFVDRGVSRCQRGGSPTVVNLSFLDRYNEQRQKFCYWDLEFMQLQAKEDAECETVFCFLGTWSTPWEEGSSVATLFGCWRLILE
jgi:hypothetical protein